MFGDFAQVVCETFWHIAVPVMESDNNRDLTEVYESTICGINERINSNAC